MTAYAAPRTTYRPYPPPMGADVVASVRASLRGYRAAFRAAGAPRQQDADFSALLLLGRD
jgi:hypothetical protein